MITNIWVGVLLAEKTSNGLNTIAMCVSCSKEWDVLRMVKLFKSEMVILNIWFIFE